jgi:GLPGLI family protein
VKYLFVILFFCFINSAFCQDNEILIFTAKYKISSKNNKQPFIDDTCVLNVSKSYSYFYSLGKEEYKEARKQKAAEFILKAVPGQDNIIQVPSLAKYFPYACLKKATSNQKFIIRRLGSVNFAYRVDDVHPIKWDIKSDTTSINGLLCIRATGMYDTTKLSVWFCPSIPISDGPIIFSGLPGLIVKSISSAGLTTELIYNNFIESNHKINKYVESFQVVSYKDFYNAVNAYKEKIKKNEAE